METEHIFDDKYWTRVNRIKAQGRSSGRFVELGVFSRPAFEMIKAPPCGCDFGQEKCTKGNMQGLDLGVLPAGMGPHRPYPVPSVVW